MKNAQAERTQTKWKAWAKSPAWVTQSERVNQTQTLPLRA